MTPIPAPSSTAWPGPPARPTGPRWSPAGLGLVVLAALAGVVALGLVVLAGRGASGPDLAVVAGVAALRPGWLVAVATGVTDAGSPTSMVVLLVLAAAGLARWARSWRPVALGGGGLAVLGGVDVGTKDLVARPRPPEALHAVAAHGYSFPSGHAMISAGVVLLVGWLVLSTSRAGATPADRHRVVRWVLGRVVGRVVTVLAGLAVLAVGASRVVLGVHYPSDVLAGWCLAVAVVGVVVLGDRRAAARVPR